MKRTHDSDDVRERALAAIDEGRSVVDVAAFFQNDPSTLRRWMRQRKRTGSGLSRPRPGPRRLIPAEREADLRTLLRNHADATLAELCALWREHHMVAVSVSTMGRTVRRLGFTLKKDVDRAGTGPHRPPCLAGRDAAGRPAQPDLPG